MKHIYYIETTLNGYITKEIKICPYGILKDYCSELNFKLDGEEIEYYDKISGDWDELDLFLKRGKHYDCKEYKEETEKYFSTQPNVYLEFWDTFATGYYYDVNKIVGIMVK